MEAKDIDQNKIISDWEVKIINSLNKIIKEELTNKNNDDFSDNLTSRIFNEVFNDIIINLLTPQSKRQIMLKKIVKALPDLNYEDLDKDLSDSQLRNLCRKIDKNMKKMQKELLEKELENEK